MLLLWRLQLLLLSLLLLLWCVVGGIIGAAVVVCVGGGIIVAVAVVLVVVVVAAAIDVEMLLLLPPFTADDALAALRTLRCWPVLAGTRGESAADVAAVARAVVAVGELVRKSSPPILSLDINPLIVSREGYAIVDAVVVREEA